LDGRAADFFEKFQRGGGNALELPWCPRSANRDDMRPQGTVDIGDLGGNQLDDEHIRMLGEGAVHPEDIVTARMRPPRPTDRSAGHEGAYIRQTSVSLQNQPVLFQCRKYSLRYLTVGDHWFVPCVFLASGN